MRGSEDETFSLTCVIGITQFVFFSLGLMLLTIQVKVGTVHFQPTSLSRFLTAHGLWLAGIPLVWTILAAAFGSRSKVARTMTVTSGIVLAILIGAAFAAAILNPTN
jgi:hypothetical protein